MSGNGLTKEIEALLEEFGAVQLRSKRHGKWLLPNGRVFIHSKTSNSNAAVHQMRELRKLLELPREVRAPKHSTGIIKQRHRDRAAWRSEFVHVSSLQSAMRKAGLV